jgi:hypothetical protein
MAINFSKTFIYHITHIQNLSLILESGGLWSDTERERRGLCPTNISHAEIKERRKKAQVLVSKCGVVADYVPFYFCSRSPMLYSIHNGRVEGYPDGQGKILHPCACLSDVLSSCEWCASDGHAVMKWSDFYDSKEALHDFDWEAIRTNHWGYPYFTNDSDLKRRKQAEFLVHYFFPWRLFMGIGVIDSEMQKQVEHILLNTDHRPEVKVIRSWYY